MMASRGAGVSYPNGPADDHFYLTIPGPLLMLDSEARWHIDRFRAFGKEVVWRSTGTPPARLGWSPGKYVDSVLRHVGEQKTSLEGGLIFGNEWNLSGERGDHDNDWTDLERRYTFLNAQIIATAQMLRQRVRCELWYPAWSPHQHWRDHVDRWASSVDAVDVLAFHEYETLERIQDTYHWLRARWPDKKLACTEWNARQGGVAEMRRILEWFAQVEQGDPNFVGAWYFIGRWFPPADSWTNELDLEGHEDRIALFLDPPRIHAPIPEEPAPMYATPARTPTYDEIRDGAIAVADGLGIPRRRLLGLCLSESGFSLQSFDRWASIERSKRMKAAIDAQDWFRVEMIFSEIAGTATNDISFGPAHQSWWWSLTAAEQQAHPEWRHDLARIMAFRARMIEDHGTALDTAGRKVMGAGTDLDLLCRYNKPAVLPANNPNRANYIRGLAEADRILSALEPAPAPTPTETVYEQYPDPQPAGTFASAPLGVIFHGSRSGRAGNPLDAEYKGTATYEVNNPLGLGWHATVGTGKVAIHMDARRWGWNARKASDKYIGVEIAQPTVNDPLPDSVATALADYIFDHVWPVWGELWHFPSHSELEGWGETGQIDGKSDLYPMSDPRMNEFREKVYARLRLRKGDVPAPEPVPEPTPEPAPPAPSRLSVLLSEVRERLDEIERLAS